MSHTCRRPGRLLGLDKSATVLDPDNFGLLCLPAPTNSTFMLQTAHYQVLDYYYNIIANGIKPYLCRKPLKFSAYKIPDAFLVSIFPGQPDPLNFWFSGT